MKTILPWVLVVLLAAGGYWLYSENQRKDADLAKLRGQLVELDALRADNETLKQHLGDAKELERLRRENQEVYGLRNEVSRLRKSQAGQAQVAAAAAGSDAVAGSDLQSQLDQLRRDNQQLRSEVQEFQILLARQNKSTDCITNLRVIEGAKARWAEEHHKGITDTPTDDDLFGDGKYVPTKPTCPQGGFYSLNSFGVPPVCSFPGHILPP